MSEPEDNAPLARPEPGWYVLLVGDEPDLEDWRYTLNEPFDPVAVMLRGRTALRSVAFLELSDAEAVRARALPIIARLNGAMALSCGARPVAFGGISRVDPGGSVHHHVFAEATGIALGRLRVRATAEVRGPNGEKLPEPPAQPSQPQIWSGLAEGSDDVSDLLDQFGRADNWYDIYKTLEIAASIVGSKHKLRAALEPETKAYRNLDQTANYYRHARGAELPTEPISLAEAKPLLAWIVKRVLASREAR